MALKISSKTPHKAVTTNTSDFHISTTLSFWLHHPTTLRSQPRTKTDEGPHPWKLDKFYKAPAVKNGQRLCGAEIFLKFISILQKNQERKRRSFGKRLLQNLKCCLKLLF